MSSEAVGDCPQALGDTMFSITKPSASTNSARLGVLRLPNRKPIQTPHYIALGSRGAIPHLTQDNVVKHTDIRGVYMAVEDCKSSRSLLPSKPAPQKLTKRLTKNKQSHRETSAQYTDPQVQSTGWKFEVATFHCNTRGSCLDTGRKTHTTRTIAWRKHRYCSGGHDIAWFSQDASDRVSRISSRI